MPNNVWTGLSARSRVGLVALALLIVAGTAALGVWILRTDYRLLFGNLSEQDAAAVTRQLDQMKVPYKLDGDGRSVLVEGEGVHATRLKLMSADLPLRGAVGFELFNNSDFGTTEFAQKVNYQRALQGEITRTILSLSQVESARVHLALPEEGLFRRGQSKPKASITLALRDNQSVRREQVAGIQRLVAAAVPGVSSDDVTIIDQRGVALSRSDAGDGTVPVSQRLDLKREIESHLAQKAMQVLESAFGAGQAIASVDATIDMSQVRTTTEDVLAPPARKGAAWSGFVQRERETVREEGGSGAPAQSQREIDYQLGRRVEQVISTPGSVTRLQVVAVLKTPLNAAQIDNVKTVVGASVGAVRERGDTVVVHSFNGVAPVVASPLQGAAELSMAIEAQSVRSGDAGHPVPSAARASAATPERPFFAHGMLAGALVLLAVACLTFAAWRRHMRRSAAASTRMAVLSAAERDAVLDQLRGWLDPQGAPVPSTLEQRT